MRNCLFFSPRLMVPLPWFVYWSSRWCYCRCCFLILFALSALSLILFFWFLVLWTICICPLFLVFFWSSFTVFARFLGQLFLISTINDIQVSWIYEYLMVFCFFFFLCFSRPSLMQPLKLFPFSGIQKCHPNNNSIPIHFLSFY